MRGRILLSITMLLPYAGYGAAVEAEPLKAVRAGDYVYLKMPRSLVAALRSPGWGKDAPEWAASAGAFKMSPLRSLIRSPANILTAVDAEGQTREVEAAKDEIELLRDMGAKPAGTFGYALKRFLRLEIKTTEPLLVIEAGGEKHRFTIDTAP